MRRWATTNRDRRGRDLPAFTALSTGCTHLLISLSTAGALRFGPCARRQSMNSCVAKASPPRPHPARLTRPEAIARDDTTDQPTPRIRSPCAHHHSHALIQRRPSTRLQAEQTSHQTPPSRPLLSGNYGQPCLTQRTPDNREHKPPANPPQLPAHITVDLILVMKLMT
jgi:hypothetical protein